ncbi:MAG: 2-oxo acid dehydrogenase subunit E2 [Planctomycetota bacterium]
MAHQTSSNPNEFILPDLGEGVHEAELIAWRVEVGQTVDEHDILAEMETDKALVEVPSPRAGTIKALNGSVGEILNVGCVLVEYVGDDGAAAARSAPTKSAPAPAEADSAADEDDGTVVGQMSGAAAGVSAEAGKALATPAVRRMARDLGVDINTVAGSGIGGRVTKRDVEAAAKGGAKKPAAQTTSAPTTAAPTETRRPLPSAQPAQPYQRPQPLQQQYPMPQQAMPHPAMPQQSMPGMGMPAMGMGLPMLVPTPFGYMPVAMPQTMPMPYPQQAPGGIAPAPGYVPSTGQRPIPDPAQASQAPGGVGEARTAFRGVRRTIADRLRTSVNTAVHFTVVDEADVTALDDLRRRTAEQTGEKISFLPFVAAAMCRVLTGRFGAMNATVDDAAGEIVQHGPVHLGIAVDTDSGLMVPVIPDAHAMDAVQLNREIASTAKAARDRSIPRDRLMGSTFTISNVGSHAGRFATPVINYPEVAILAVGKAYDGVVVRDGQPVVAKVMPLSLACDHRVVDGATAALALAELVREISA